MKHPFQKPVFLGIEGGATRTVALLANADNKLLKRIEAGPANLRLMTDAQLKSHLAAIARSIPNPDAIAIGLAGARTDKDWQRIRAAAAKVWPMVSCHATNDLETALAASKSTGAQDASAVVLVLSGTGSCCYGRGVSGKTVKVGGWGHILGDQGSAYQIGLGAARLVLSVYDRSNRWAQLGARLLRALQLNEPEELVNWAQAAAKTGIAALAIEVFRAWNNGDKLAGKIVERAARSLAEDANACAQRLAKPGGLVKFVFSGSVLLKQPRFAGKVKLLLRKLWTRARIEMLDREGAWGAIELARQLYIFSGAAKPAATITGQNEIHTAESPSKTQDQAVESDDALALSPTEQRHPLSMHLDRMKLADAIKLMLSEDEKIPSAILAERKKIERAISMIVKAFRRGGRLFYVGAGTSGRLGALDASECPPTFSSDPEQVQAIIAGGQRALWESVEGAEDDFDAGRRAIVFRNASASDVVVGIAASGRTPFVLGALGEAKNRRASTILLTFNPGLTLRRAGRPDLVIAVSTGPEVLTGSTRLKAGTATKLVLNMFTTLAMVRLGKVVENLMVDLNPSNAKLRARAARILQQLTGSDAAAAGAALEKSGWAIRKALKSGR